MIRWQNWWFDLLLAATLGLTIILVLTQPPPPSALLFLALGLVLFGYVLVRVRFALAITDESILRDYLGSLSLIAGLVIGSYFSSQSSLMLTIACPIIWQAMRTLRRGIAWNVALILLVAAAIATQSYRQSSLARDWPAILGGTVLILIFSITIGTMVHSVKNWGLERAELLADLQASQKDLGESYRALTISTTATPTAESPLSTREIEVLTLASQGFTNREIGLRLFISPATVKTHMEHILAKLSATTRTQAVLIAHRDGLLAESFR